MDKTYADTVRLLLRVAPQVFQNPPFAMKGGTAINLFVRDMPRLSVDIDMIYTPVEKPREEALKAIADETVAITRRLTDRGLRVKSIPTSDGEESTILVANESVQVKIEINRVFRGTVLPVQTRPLVPPAAAMFSAELSLPILAVDELYGSKLVAAMDRQHPRDLFDVHQLFQSGGITDDMVECFVVYLAGHNRPIHEVLFAKPKDIARAFETTFAGMTTDPVSLNVLVAARTRLFQELPRRLTPSHRGFLTGLSRGEPDWNLLAHAHVKELPAIRWKIQNLEKLHITNRTKFDGQVKALEDRLQAMNDGTTEQ